MSTDPRGSGGAAETGPGGEAPRMERHHLIDLEFVRSLIAAVDDSGIDSLEISRGGTRIRIAKTPVPVATVTPSPNHGVTGASSGTAERTALPVPAGAPEPAPAE